VPASHDGSPSPEDYEIEQSNFMWDQIGLTPKIAAYFSAWMFLLPKVSATPFYVNDAERTLYFSMTTIPDNTSVIIAGIPSFQVSKRR
jgi:hypothetical protein